MLVPWINELWYRYRNIEQTEDTRRTKNVTHLSIATSNLLYNSRRCLRKISGFGLCLIWF